MLAVALLAVAAAALAREHHVLRRAEHASLDARYQVRGNDPAKLSQFVFVDVDETTFNDLRAQHKAAQWPFPRRYHARVIDALRRAGARVIGFDVQFTEPTNPTDDNALIRAIARAGNVVLSTTVVGPHGTTAVLGGDAVLRKVGARVGNTSLIPDSDGALRRTQYALGGLKSFGVVLAEADGRRVADFGGVPIDYAGPPGTVRSIPYSRVLDRHFDAADVAGKIVIVGTSAISLQDLHETPIGGGGQMAGPEVLANAASTVIRGEPLRNADPWLLLLIPLALALIGMRFGTLTIVLSGLALLAGWAVAAQVAFNRGTVLDVADPALALLLATLGCALVGLWADRRERQRLREAFAAAAPGVVDDVLGAGRALAPTAIIAGYRIEAAVGRGGMGVVYRATQLALDRPVAVKLIATERAQDPVFRARFERESRLSASIEHVNVIPVYEAGEDAGLLYIVMRLVDGFDLGELLGDGALEPGRVVRIVTQLAGALDAAHARGLVHRDVKPANVLLTLEDHVYLTDFGVAKQVGGDATHAGWVGTLDYVAPEQLGGADAVPAGDVYALAALLYHCLTGQVPFPRDSDAAKLWAHVNAEPPLISALRPGLPAGVDEVIVRGMAKDPAARFANAGELARALAAAMGETVLAPRPRVRPDGPPVAPTRAPGA